AAFLLARDPFPFGYAHRIQGTGQRISAKIERRSDGVGVHLGANSARFVLLRYTHTLPKIMKNLLRIIAFPCIFLFLGRAADAPALQGFSADAATSERAWEAK